MLSTYSAAVAQMPGKKTGQALSILIPLKSNEEAHIMDRSHLEGARDTAGKSPSIMLGQFIHQQLREQALPAIQRTYTRGDLLYGMDFPAEEVFYLLEGRVLISRFSQQGNVVILDYREGGEVVGEHALCGMARRATEARAVRQTRVLIVKARQVLSALQRQQHDHLLFQCLSRELLDTLGLVELFALDGVEHRLAKRLLSYSQKTRGLHPSGPGMLDFSHEELAQMVGTTRQVVTQIMEKFRSAGLLDYARRQITIKEEQVLAFLQQGHRPS